MTTIMFWLLVLLLPAAGFAQPAHPVNRATAEAFAACRALGGRPEIKAGYQTNYEINHDGKPDVILDFAKFDCVDGGPPQYCGSGGCTLRIFVSGPQGLYPALTSTALRWSVGLQGRVSVLTLWLRGEECGLAGTAACEKALVWKGEGMVEQRGGAPFPPR